MQVLSENTLAGTGHFVTITYDRVEKLNALNSEGIDALSLSFDAIADDPEVRAVILEGAGQKAFVGGADIVELKPNRDHHGMTAFIGAKFLKEILDRMLNG